MSPTNNHVLYDRHPEEWQKCLNDENRIAVATTWMRKDTVDSWRHNRMRQKIDPFIDFDKESRWLTVGDGRFGTDANYIITKGGNAHATDFDSALLEIGSGQGFISSYGAENAENLSFANESFDYIFCKEAFHHFPRPWMAVYEMLRVAKEGVILIEPVDGFLNANTSILQLVKRKTKNFLKSLLGTSKHNSQDIHFFEPIGNYIFTISLHECEKILLGMHYRYIAFIGINDYYQDGVEFCPIEGGTSEEQQLRAKVFTNIAKADITSRRTGKYGLICIAMFKKKPRQELIASLCLNGWQFKELPLNPYLTSQVVL